MRHDHISFFNKTLNRGPCSASNLNWDKPHQQQTLSERKEAFGAKKKKKKVDRTSLEHGKPFVYQTKGEEVWRGGGTERVCEDGGI